jgi:hypothetical protein
MKCNQLLCAQTILIDSLTRRTSAINILEDKSFNTLPTILPLMVYALVEKEPGDNSQGVLEIEISMGETRITNHSQDLNFGSNRFAKAVVNLGTLPIATPGKLKVVVKINGSEARSITAEIGLRPTPKEAGASIPS